MVEIPEHLRAHLTDSAGQPWKGRTLSDNPWAHDDGEAPAALLQRIREYRERSSSVTAVIDELRHSRVLIPLVAHLGETGTNAAGQTVDKSADLSIVTVQAPDGRAALPVFTSVTAMSRWNAQARPVPIEVRKAALAAVGEQTELLILDPGSETELAIRRPALWAIAQDTPYELPWQHAHVQRLCSELFANHPEILAIDLQPGDPDSRLRAPELIVALGIDEQLSKAGRDALLATVQRHIAADAALPELVDSLAIRIRPVARDSAERADELHPQQEGAAPSQSTTPPSAGLFGWLRRR